MACSTGVVQGDEDSHPVAQISVMKLSMFTDRAIIVDLSFLSSNFDRL